MPVEIVGDGVEPIGFISNLLLEVTFYIWSGFMLVSGVEPDGIPVKVKK